MAFGFGSDGRSVPCCVHVAPLRWKTYASPSLPLANDAPTTASSPFSATLMPKNEFTAASSAVSVACSLHVAPLRTNT
jgi:hypothetical protein